MIVLPSRRLPLASIPLVLLVAGACLNPRASYASARPAAGEGWVFTQAPARLVNGSPLFMEVRPPRALHSLQGTWLGHTLSFSFDPDRHVWTAVAGVSLDTRPGRYPLALEGEANDGARLAFTRKLAVGRGKYRSVTIQVEKKFVEPDPEQLAEIKRDQEFKKERFAAGSAGREWAGRFDAPVASPVSGVFGTRRVLNGKVQSVHQGLDYAAPAGTAVNAANAGTVLIARPLYFEGNCVIVDHGQGLMTLYLHLSRLLVKEGDVVRRGQELGESGSTGRATGPHLHFAVRWQGEYLDPATLLALKIPR